MGQDGFLKVVEFGSRSVLKSFKISEFCLSAWAVVKEGEVFALGSWDNMIYIFNLVYGSRSKPLQAHDNSVSALLFLPLQSRLISASWDCTLKSWDYSGHSGLAFD